MRCGDADDVTGPQAPAANIAGAWAGSFSLDNLDCEGTAPARATFEQRGGVVTGTLEAPATFCGLPSVRLEGTLDGRRLTGTISGYHLSAVSGYVGDGSLDLNLTDPRRPTNLLVGRVSLRR